MKKTRKAIVLIMVLFLMLLLPIKVRADWTDHIHITARPDPDREVPEVEVPAPNPIFPLIPGTEEVIEGHTPEVDHNIRNEIEEFRNTLNTAPITGGMNPDDSTYEGDQKTSPDEIIDEGSDFIQAGKDNQDKINVDGDKLQQGSDMLYNIAFAVGVVVAVGIGTYLGVKFMIGGAEEKANIKETLIPYFVGVIIMFSSFTIWKLVLVLLQSIDNI